MIRTLAIAALLMLAVACGGDEVAAPAPTPNNVSQQTAVPAPISSTPLNPVSGLSASQWALRGLTTLRQFPTTLEAESNRLPESLVVTLWDEFLGGTIWVNNLSGIELFEFCSDNTGTHLQFFDDSSLEDLDFTWSIVHPGDGAWNAIVITNAAHDFTGSLLVERGAGVFFVPPVSSSLRTTSGPIDTGGTTLFFESPACD